MGALLAERKSRMSTKQKVMPWAVAVAWGIMACAAVEVCLLNGSQFYRTVADDLGFAVSQLGLLMTFYSITLVIASPIAGRLFERYDSRIVLSGMGLIVFAGFAGMSFYTQVWMWWVSGILFAIGGAGLFIIGAPIFINNWFHKRAGFAMGLYGIVIAALGLVVAQVIPFVIVAVGWRTAYLVMAAIAAAFFFPCAIFLSPYKPEDVGLKPYGYEEDDAGEGKEKKSTPGIPYKKAVLSISFVLAIIAFSIMCNMNGYKSNWSNMAQHATWDYGIIFGGTMMFATTMAKFFSPLLGLISDKWGAIATGGLTLGLIAIGMLLLLFFHDVQAVVPIACFLVGFETCNMKVVIPLIIRDIYGSKDYTRIYSFAFGIFNVFSLFSVSLVALAGEVTGSFNIAFIVGAIGAVAAFLLILLSKKASKGVAWEE